MSSRPNGHKCRSCPAYNQGVLGFMGEGDGAMTSGVMLCADSLGYEEAKQLKALCGPSGFLLGRVMQRKGWDRDFFNYQNILRCKPIGNRLKFKSGQYLPWVVPAMDHCETYLDAQIAKRKPKVIVALGDVAFERLTRQPLSVSDAQGYAFRDHKNRCWVVPTPHPAFILRGNQHLSLAMMLHLEKAVRIAATPDFTLETPTLLCDPKLPEWEDYVRRCIAAIQGGAPLALDIETPFKRNRDEDELDVTAQPEGQIDRVSFAFSGETAVSVLWQMPYLPGIRKIVETTADHGLFTIWNCPTPDQRVLTSDLRWVPAGELRVGDTLVGVDEEAIGMTRPLRRHRTTTVTHAERGVAEVFAVYLSDGSTVKVTGEHQWLVSSNSSKDRTWSWCATRDLRVKHHVVQRLHHVWDQSSSRERDWLAGFFDGEGHLTTIRTGACRVGASQKFGHTLEYAQECLHQLGISFRVSAPNRAKDNHCAALYLGSAAATAKFLGMARPVRLLPKFQPEHLGTVLALDRPRVIRVVSLGEQEIVRLSTSTHTYILEGFTAHNCAFDKPRVEQALNLTIPRERVRDSMDAFHVLYNVLRRRLGGATAVLPSSWRLGAWKHLSNLQPAYYSAMDALALWRNDSDILRLLAQTGQDRVYGEVCADLDPALHFMAGQGLLVDQEARSALSGRVDAAMEALRAQFTQVVPKEVLSTSEWKTLKAGEKGLALLKQKGEVREDLTLFSIPGKVKEKVCGACGAHPVKKDHVARRTLKVPKEPQAAQTDLPLPDPLTGEAVSLPTRPARRRRKKAMAELGPGTEAGIGHLPETKGDPS